MPLIVIIGGDRIQNVPWRSNNLPSSPFFQNAVILCGTNNIQQHSSEDIVGGILEIALTLRRKYNHLNIDVCCLLPRDENCSVNQIYLKEINDYLSFKCDLNGINFIKPNNWTLHNGSLKANLFYVDNLHLIQDRNIKLSESIVSVIKPNSKTTESVSMSSKLFNPAADFNFSDKDFPLLPCTTTVCNFVCSSKPVCTSNVLTSKPVCTSHVHTSKPVCTSHVHTSKPVCTGNVHSSKPVCTNNARTSKPVCTSHVCSSELVCTCNFCASKTACDSCECTSKPVFTRKHIFK